MPKNAYGNLEDAAARRPFWGFPHVQGSCLPDLNMGRYVLHRLFVQRHAMYIKVRCGLHPSLLKLGEV